MKKSEIDKIAEEERNRGKSTKRIQEYIANQLKEDHGEDQMTLNEYIDPFMGEPVQKGTKK